MKHVRIYETHDNGGRPFAVHVTDDRIDVFALHGPNRDAPVYTFVHYSDVFVYNEGAGTEGNSILIEEVPRRYVHVGAEVFRFWTDDEITQYASPIGNSDVPYPVAYGNRNVYFVLDRCFVPRRVLGDRVEASQAMEHYGDFYARRDRAKLLGEESGIERMVRTETIAERPRDWRGWVTR